MTKDCAESIPQREEEVAEAAFEEVEEVEEAEEEEEAPPSPAKVAEDILERLIRAVSSGQEGEVEVSFLLGEIYAHGLPKDPKKAAGYYAEAIMKRHVEAYFKLGLLYEAGCGVEQNHTLALRRFKKAADMGHTEAQFRLGKMYVEGRGQTVVEHKPRGCALLRAAAQNGHEEAARLYAQVRQETLRKHFSEAATDEDEKLLAELRETAKKRKREEWFEAWGWHPPADEKKLRQWYIKAVKDLAKRAEAGNVTAQWQLAEIYREGLLGVPRNHELAQAWYKKVADSYMQSPQPREVEVNYRLGAMFLKGRGVEKNRSEAMEWFKKAAMQGHAHAQYHVGKMYAGGECGSGKIAQAIKWYTKAASQGHPRAQFCLKKLSITGQGAAKQAKAALAEVAQATAALAKMAQAEAALAEVVQAKEVQAQAVQANTALDKAAAEKEGASP